MDLSETTLAQSPQTLITAREPPITEPNHSSLAVCICTFKRPEGLRRLLHGLDAQVFHAVPTPSVCLIVVDNSPHGDAADICIGRPSPWPLQYVHEPRPGISYARNTALAAVPAGTDFIAMIDDDEVPAANWLEQLLAAQVCSGADIVVGPAIPVFPQGTPDWVAASGIFLKPHNALELLDLDPEPPAATCNVLVRASLLGASGRSFDPALGLSGGEDKLLFQSLKLNGHRFAWAAQAYVSEIIPPERANFGYMWRESYRRGCVKYYVKCHLKATSAPHKLRIGFRMAVRGLGGTLIDLLRVLGTFTRGRAVWVPCAVQAAENLGSVAGTLRIPNRHYRNGKQA